MYVLGMEPYSEINEISMDIFFNQEIYVCYAILELVLS